MAYYFISDLHLYSKQPHLAQLFEHFLKNIAVDAERLYILGDLFEAWIGDDNQSPFNCKIKQLLREFSRHKPIYIMHGNRDFLLGDRFCRETGCTLLPDPTIVDVYGKPTLLMHGDSLCTDDAKYMAFREKARSTDFQRRILSNPLWLRKLIAWRYRYSSKKHTKEADSIILDANASEIKKVMANLRINSLIHGHTHRPGIHYFYINNVLKQRVILSDWQEKGNYFVCYPNGKKYLMYFDCHYI